MKPLERLIHRASFRTGITVLRDDLASGGHHAISGRGLPSFGDVGASRLSQPAYFNEVGGHFAAWEEPDLFASELRAAFRSLRSVN